MEEPKGLLTHMLLVQLKPEITPAKKDEIIKRFADLQTVIKQIKGCYWGTDVSQENLQQGFTHAFESTFESTEGVAEYGAHPAHVEFANSFLPTSEKIIVIDYKPIPVLV